MSPTWLVRLGVFLQPRDEVVELLFPLLLAFKTLLEELWIVSRSQLLLAGSQPGGEGRSANGDEGATAPELTLRSPLAIDGRLTYAARILVHNHQFVGFFAAMLQNISRRSRSLTPRE